MSASSKLFLPSVGLSDCVYAGIYRDTHGCDFSEYDRLNYFPASPLVTITICLSGELYEVPLGTSIADAQARPPLPRLFVTMPQNSPTVSWGAGPIRIVSLCFFPDAWSRLTSACDVAAILDANFDSRNDTQVCWDRCCRILCSAWMDARKLAGTPAEIEAPTIADWVRTQIARATIAGPGRGVRSVERRLQRWTGQSRQSLTFFERFEDLLRIAMEARQAPLAEIAVIAGYSDQSHMGRVVRRATGFSPARLNSLIETEEAFWCYRLLGERF